MNSTMACLNEYSASSLLVGFAFSVLAGYYLVRAAAREMQKNLGKTHNEFGWHPRAIGLVERSLYTLSWLVGKPEFIGVWLALKVAGQWGRWQTDEGGVPGRAVFNVFLLGNGLSVSYGIVGGMVTEWIDAGWLLRAVVVATLLVLGTCCIRRMAATSRRLERL